MNLLIYWVLAVKEMTSYYPVIRFNNFYNSWRKIPWNQAMKVNSGKDYKHLESGDIPVYGTGGYMLSVNEKLSDKDAIGLGRKGTINKPQYLQAPFWTVDTLFYMTPLQDFDLNFLYSMTQKINWKKLDESTGVPSLSKLNIEKISQIFPEVYEQIEIGAFFKNLDSLIELHQHELTLLKQRKKAFLQKMFPKKGDCGPEIRFSEFTETWVEHKLGSLVKIKSGFTGNSLLNEGKYELTRIETISDGNINLRKVGFSNDNPGEKYLLTIGDILYSNINSLAHIGKVAQYNYNIQLFHGINLLRLIPTTIIDSNFIFQYLGTRYSRIWAKTHANQAVNQASINQTELSKQTFIIPNIKEQIKIGNFFKELDKSISLQEQKLESLKQMKKAFLQKMFV